MEYGNSSPSPKLPDTSADASRAFTSWGVPQWNAAFLRHFFLSPSETGRLVERLYITRHELQLAVSADNTPAEEVRKAFIEAMRKALGGDSLGLDAENRAQCWTAKSKSVPPFLCHLLFTCMVANDLAEEVQHTGNFRTRLALLLGGGTNHGLERLRRLWDLLAQWLMLHQSEIPGLRTLILPHIPKHGRLSIIGYSLRLSFPSRTDQMILSSLMYQRQLLGREPSVTDILALVTDHSSRFSSDFRQMFEEFIDSLKVLPRSVVFNTTFWLAIRHLALSAREVSQITPSTSRIRLEMEDEDGHFIMYLTTDRESKAGPFQTVELPVTTSSPFRHVLVAPGGGADELIDSILFRSSGALAQEPMFRTVRAAMADGVLLFCQDDLGSFTLA
jgi:hypothetical protein